MLGGLLRAEQPLPPDPLGQVLIGGERVAAESARPDMTLSGDPLEIGPVIAIAGLFQLVTADLQRIYNEIKATPYSFPASPNRL